MGLPNHLHFPTDWKEIQKQTFKRMSSWEQPVQVTLGTICSGQLPQEQLAEVALQIACSDPSGGSLPRSRGWCELLTYRDKVELYRSSVLRVQLLEYLCGGRSGCEE